MSGSLVSKSIALLKCFLKIIYDFKIENTMISADLVLLLKLTSPNVYSIKIETIIYYANNN